ncbi:MAG: transposase family protein, partial [Caulobacteraceae bacterium]
PVRLPTAPSNQAVLDHYLGDPSKWHKIDLVRTQAPNAAGGWRYEAHLVVLTTPYVSPAVTERRATIAIEAMDRVAGIDVNVSNISIASHETGRSMRLTRIERDQTQKRSDRKRARRERRRLRELERSRRAMNRAQYQLSKRQEKRARRRAAAGQRSVEVIPMGPRNARTDGVPLQSYRRDRLSASFRRGRAAQAAEAASATQAARDRARTVAAEVVGTHGYQPIVEDCSIAAWSRSWGRAVAAFAPGMLITAIDREVRAVAAVAGTTGRVQRAATRTTALSQHCPCGRRVAKRLADRTHVCPSCRLRGDRDAIAAVLASFIVFDKPGEPSSARVDYDAADQALAEIRRVVRDPYSGWQDTLSESTDLSARDGSFIAWWTSTPDAVAVARRTVGTAVCPTLNETGARRTTSERTRWRTNMSPMRDPWSYLRDTS